MQFPDLDIELTDEEIRADLCYPAPTVHQQGEVPFAVRIAVRNYELDALGHVNHAVYLQYAAHRELRASVRPPGPRDAAARTPAGRPLPLAGEAP